MSILNIIKFPNTYLNKKSKNIDTINDTIKKITDDLIETMFHYDALGIAATQVNIPKSLIIVNMSNNYTKQALTIINPKIIYKKYDSINEEGCLSFPNIFVKIKRHRDIFVSFFDINNKKHYLKCNRMLSICLQHEIDHLNGITIYDKVNNLKKKLILKNLK